MLVKGSCDTFLVWFPGILEWLRLLGIADKTGKGRSDEGKLLLGHAQQVVVPGDGRRRGAGLAGWRASPAVTASSASSGSAPPAVSPW
jgi:hypothetical protein